MQMNTHSDYPANNGLLVYKSLQARSNWKTRRALTVDGRLALSFGTSFEFQFGAI